FSSRRRHTRWPRDWSSDVCSSDLHSQMSSEANFIFVRENGWLTWEAGRLGPTAYSTIGHLRRSLILVSIQIKASLPSVNGSTFRSEERRVGKECRSRWQREY